MQQSIPWGMDIWVFELLPWGWCLKVVAWEIHALSDFSNWTWQRWTHWVNPFSSQHGVYSLQVLTLYVASSFEMRVLLWWNHFKRRDKVAISYDCYFQCQTTEEQLFRKQLCFRKRHIGNTIACQVFEIKIYCCWFTTFLNIPLMSTGQTYLAL